MTFVHLVLKFQYKVSFPILLLGFLELFCFLRNIFVTFVAINILVNILAHNFIRLKFAFKEDRIIWKDEKTHSSRQ